MRSCPGCEGSIRIQAAESTFSQMIHEFRCKPQSGHVWAVFMQEHAKIGGLPLPSREFWDDLHEGIGESEPARDLFA